MSKGKEILLSLTIGDEGVTVWIDEKHIITAPNIPLTVKGMRVVFPAPNHKQSKEDKK